MKLTKIYSLHVPPTHEIGSYTSTVYACGGETHRQHALWDYNRCRSHDGLPPLKRMPNGTTYTLRSK